MNKRMLFVLAAVVLFGLGFYYRYQNGINARAQTAAMLSGDLAAASPESIAPSVLADFVHAHMGASVTYTLIGSYNRAATAAQAAAAAQAANSQVYADAQRACAGKTDSITQAKCNAQYLANHVVATPTATPVAAPKLSDYKVTLRSPVWTPDLAGALFLGGAVAVVLGLISFRRHR